MDRRFALAAGVILVAFAVGLVGFFLFSNGQPDGLDKTMQDSGVPESEPVYTAPLSYGDGYAGSLIMGAIGFFITLAIMLGILKLRKAAKSEE